MGLSTDSGAARRSIGDRQTLPEHVGEAVQHAQGQSPDDVIVELNASKRSDAAGHRVFEVRRRAMVKQMTHRHPENARDLFVLHGSRV